MLNQIETNKSICSTIWDDFGIKYVDRSGTKTNFIINDNENVNKNMDLIVKLLCFYSVAIFETDSVEKEIYYKIDNKIVCGKIDDVVYKLFCKFLLCEEIKEVSNKKTESSESNESFGSNESSESLESFENSVSTENDKHNNHTLAHMNLLDIGEIFCGRDTYSKTYKKFHDQCKETPVVKYAVTENKYNTYAMISGSPDVYDFSLDKSVPYQIIKEIGEDEETMGNYGSYTYGPGRGHKMDSQFDCKDEDKKISSKTETKYVAFDFDKFDIHVKKINDLGTEYQCVFSETNGIHHAASMWATNCLVECTNTYISGIELVNTISLNLKKENGLIYVTTTYFAINCL